MASRACHSIYIAGLIRSIQSPPVSKPKPNHATIIQASSRKQYDISPQVEKHFKKNNSRKGPRTPRRPQITISTSDGRWHGKWTDEFVLSLRELHLEDLAEDGMQEDEQVFISLSVHRHAGFGFSVDGRITSSFTRKCSNCSSLYCREIKGSSDADATFRPFQLVVDVCIDMNPASTIFTIFVKIDTTFNVWILPSSRSNNALQLPEIGGDDPSVIYVKPGSEANLDSLIQDTIRLTTSVKATCSESCEKAPPTLYHIGRKEAYVDKRWSKLLELKNAL